MPNPVLRLHLFACTVASYLNFQLRRGLTNTLLTKMLSCVGYCMVLTLVALPGAALCEMVFRCPSCTAERQSACPELTETCVEIVREPGCGCCPVCARQQDEFCGVYTPRCANGFRCYPQPDSELPLEQLVKGHGRCGRKVDTEPAVEQSGKG